MYDELGNRYVIPKYCISKPKNFSSGEDDADLDGHIDSSTQLLHGHSPSHNSKRVSTKSGSPLVLKVRLSGVSKDIKVAMTTQDRVRDLKKKMHEDYNVEINRITMLYYGKVLNNGTLLKDLGIPKGFVIQAIVT